MIFIINSPSSKSFSKKKFKPKNLKAFCEKNSSKNPQPIIIIDDVFFRIFLQNQNQTEPNTEVTPPPAGGPGEDLRLSPARLDLLPRGGAGGGVRGLGREGREGREGGSFFFLF